eukprot:5088072-Pyramimonas_sp.AAC.1
MVSRRESGPDSPRETPRRGQSIRGGSRRAPRLTSTADALLWGIGARFSTGDPPPRTEHLGWLPDGPEASVRDGWSP